MPERVRQTLEVKTTIQCGIDLRSQRYWKDRNSKRFAMAPTALVEKGEVTEEKYQEERRKFNDGVRDHKLYEVIDLARLGTHHQIPNQRIWEIGWGEGDGVEHIPAAHQRGLEVQVADHDHQVLDRAVRFLESLPQRPDLPEPSECIHEVDMVYAVEELMLPRDSAIDVSRVVHHQKRKKQSAFWTACGRFLAGGGFFPTPPRQRRLVVTNPDARDNRSWIDGENRWQTVRPFNMDEQLPVISEAAGYEVRIVRESEPFEVFGEVFRVFTIMLAT